MLAIDNLYGKNRLGVSIYQKWIKSRNKREVHEATLNLVLLYLNIAQNYNDKYL